MMIESYLLSLSDLFSLNIINFMCKVFIVRVSFLALPLTEFKDLDSSHTSSMYTTYEYLFILLL